MRRPKSRPGKRRRFIRRYLAKNIRFTLAVSINLAEIYRALGRFEEAEPLYRRSIAIYEANPRRDLIIDIAQNLAGISSIYLSQRRFAEAVSFATRAQENFTKIYGPNELMLYQFARVDMAQSHFAEAKQKLERILSSYRSLGADHDNWLMALTDLSGQYFEQQDWVQATASLQKRGRYCDPPVAARRPVGWTGAHCSNLTLF